MVLHKTIGFIKQIFNPQENLDNLKVEINVKCSWFGNNYGGFYVATESLNQSSIIYSFGIGEDISFDLDLNKCFQCNVHMFDPTPKSIDWIQKQGLKPDFKFYKYGIGAETLDAKFYLPRNPNHVSGSLIVQNNVNSSNEVVVHVKSIKDICSELCHDRIDVLKIDIEGAEYDVLQSVLDSKIHINQILVEFHSRFVDDGATKTDKALYMLKNHGYKIFGVSDSFQEVSFIKC
jgi:FkbM family methyltransferase